MTQIILNARIRADGNAAVWVALILTGKTTYCKEPFFTKLKGSRWTFTRIRRAALSVLTSIEELPVSGNQPGRVRHVFEGN